MNVRRRRSLLGASVLAVLIAACSSDSTGPRSSDLATYYDSLYEHLDPPGELNPLLDLRANILGNIEIAIAFGAIPRAVSVTTASGIEHWHGVEFMVNPNGSQFDFSHTLIVYRDTDAHTASDGAVRDGRIAEIRRSGGRRYNGGDTVHAVRNRGRDITARWLRNSADARQPRDRSHAVGELRRGDVHDLDFVHPTGHLRARSRAEEHRVRPDGTRRRVVHVGLWRFSKKNQKRVMPRCLNVCMVVARATSSPRRRIRSPVRSVHGETPPRKAQTMHCLVLDRRHDGYAAIGKQSDREILASGISVERERHSNFPAALPRRQRSAGVRRRFSCQCAQRANEESLPQT